MLELNAASYTRVVLVFAQMTRLVWQMSAISGAPKFDGESSRGILKNLSEMSALVEAMGARLTASAIRKLLNDINNGEITYAQIVARRLSEIELRLLDEIDRDRIFVVQNSDAYFFDNIDNFLDAEAQRVFPNAIFDGDEAGKCFALGRYTASVFHVMRASEAVVGSLATKLGVTVSDQHGRTLTWGGS